MVPGLEMFCERTERSQGEIERPSETKGQQKPRKREKKVKGWDGKQEEA